MRPLARLIWPRAPLSVRILAAAAVLAVAFLLGGAGRWAWNAVSDGPPQAAAESCVDDGPWGDAMFDHLIEAATDRLFGFDDAAARHAAADTMDAWADACEHARGSEWADEMRSHADWQRIPFFERYPDLAGK